MQIKELAARHKACRFLYSLNNCGEPKHAPAAQ
jgi:hypothetical protein